MTSISDDKPPLPGLTDDRILGGRVAMWQPATGYRAGLDAVLLAAATPAMPGQSILDLGTGAGAVFLCLAARVPGLDIAALEIQADYAELARANAARNNIPVEVTTGDVAAMPASIKQRRFHHIVTNPPYFDRATGSPSANAGRDIAFGGETPLTTWVLAASRRLLPRGQLTLIQRAHRLPDILGALQGQLGSVRVWPLVGREGRPADRIILRARKEGNAPFRLNAPIVLHEGPAHIRDAEDYTAEIQSVLRDCAPLTLQD